MYSRRFFVRIKLQLHAITCPGVWLCSHGYLEATVKTLGYYFRTGAMEPHFPLLCHDKFIIEGYFKSVSTMDELERILAAERVEITLWQNGRRLAYFLGKLCDVMHVNLPKVSCMHNISVQLLMKPTPAFPGIIAPKVELSVDVGVQDRSSTDGSHISKCNSDCYITPNFELNVMPKKNRHFQHPEEGSNCFRYIQQRRRQKPVCHSKDKCNTSCSYSTTSSQCLNSSKLFEADSISHINGKRRLSASSSYLSSNSYTSSPTSRSSSVCGCHLLTSNISGTAAVEHQRSCDICQLYKRVFL